MKERIVLSLVVLLEIVGASSIVQASPNSVDQPADLQRTVESVKRDVNTEVAVATSAVKAEVVDEQTTRRETKWERRARKKAQAERDNALLAEEPLPLGIRYYRNLLDRSIIRHWAFAILGHYSWADDAFDCRGCPDSIAKSLFGDPFTIGDVYLLSKLSFLDKIRRDNIESQGKERPAISNLPFGDFASDQFLNLLAPTKVNISAHFKEMVAKFTAVYRFLLTSDEKLVGAIGFTLPVKKRENIMDLSFTDGTLFTHAFIPSSNVRSNPLVHFTEFFTDVNDFFQRAVLAPKGLTFDGHQIKTGVGDVTFFGYLDFAGYWQHFDAFQVGINFVFPTGNKQTGNKIWEVELGNGGAYQFDPFLSILFCTPAAAFNPTFKLAGEISAGFTGARRIPSLKSNTNAPRDQIVNVADLATLFVPPISEAYSGYYVDTFSEFDTTVPWFADKVTCAKIKYGGKLAVGIGNYFYNAFNLGLRLGLFYDYNYKGKDTICIDPACGTFNTCALTARTEQHAHLLSWNLTYKFRSMVELNMGSQHVFAGINVPRCHDFFASVILVF